MYNRYIPCEDGLHRRIPFPEEPLFSDIPPSAARSAAGGDTGQLAELLRSVTASPEGAKLLSSLQKALEQQT